MDNGSFGFRSEKYPIEDILLAPFAEQYPVEHHDADEPVAFYTVGGRGVLDHDAPVLGLKMQSK